MIDHLFDRPGDTRILMVEDDDDHAHLATRVLKRCDHVARLDRARNGVDALDYLKARSLETEKELPEVVLLDLKLPKMGGLEFLREVQKDPVLACLAVIVITTSSTDQDRMEAYGAGANSYLVKPVDPLEFQHLFKILGEYWGHLNVPPLYGGIDV